MSVPVIAIVVTIIFSFWSPIGLGSLVPLSSIAIAFLFLGILPVAPVIYSAKKKTVDLYVSRMERRTPFFLMAITSYACAATIFFITDSRIMFLVAVSYICVTLSVMLVNLFWKISVHSAAVAGPVAGLVYVFGIKAMPLYVLLVPIVWARMKLGAHTLAQLIAGIVLSTLVTLGVCAFLYP